MDNNKNNNNKKNNKIISNPFSPTFGQVPRDLLGRNLYIDAFMEGLDASRSNPNRTTLYSGIRGAGKTALLNQVAKLAAGRGWLVIDVVATDSMLEEIIEVAEMRLSGKSPAQHELDSISLGALGFSAGVGISKTKQNVPGWRAAFTNVCERAAKKKQGVLVLIDEIQHKTPRVRQFAIVYQQLLAEGYDLACIMAGLPQAISDVLNDDVLTFLRRAHQEFLTGIDFQLVLRDYRKVFTAAGYRCDEDALTELSRRTSGYPYLIQLLGYYAFKLAAPSQHLNLKMVSAALEHSKDDMAKAVHQPILASLSDREVSYLKAMAEDEGPSKTADITARLAVKPQYAATYRRRLVEAGVIVATSRGQVAFAVPTLADYLRSGGPTHPNLGFQDYAVYGR
jgi:hypothetical protein